MNQGGAGKLKRVLLTPFALLLAAMSFGCARTPQQKEAKFLAGGKKYFAKKDFPRAALQFKNAAGAMPRDAEPFYQLGLTFLAMGDVRNGAACLNNAIALNPNHVAAQLKLAELMEQTGDKKLLEEAEKRLTAVLGTAPENPDALNTLALTELKLGRPQDAIQHLDQALTHFPKHLQASVTLAKAKLMGNDSKGAESVLKKACIADPKSADALVALGSLYSFLHRDSEALDQYQRALQITPADGAALFNLAMAQWRLGKKQDAEQSFRRLSGFSGKAYRPAHAIFLFQEGRRDEAIREFDQLVKKDPEDRSLRTQLVAAYWAVNRAADARKVLNAALQKNPKDLDALLQRSEILLAAGKLGDAETDLNQVLHLRRNSAEAHYILSKVYQARGATLTRRQELSDALNLNPYLLAVRLELVELLTATNAANTALQILEETPDPQKGLLPVVVQRNWALWALGDLAGMRKGIDLGFLQERSADLLIQDGLWKLRAGKPAEARTVLEEALKIDPSDLRALEALNRTYIAQKKAPLALQKVREYAAQQPKSAPVQQFLGLLYWANGDQNQARAAFLAAKAADPQYARADLSLVQMDARESKWDDARNRLVAVLNADNGNITARLWLGNIEAIKGNYNAALEQFRKTVEISPDNPRALNNLAYLLADYRNQPDEALKYAEKAQELAPGDPDFADTLGWILYQKGLYGPAIKYLERAASRGDNVVWKYHLAMAYAKAADSKRARATLSIALKENPSVPEAKMATELLGSK